MAASVDLAGPWADRAGHAAGLALHLSQCQAFLEPGQICHFFWAIYFHFSYLEYFSLEKRVEIKPTYLDLHICILGQEKV